MPRNIASPTREIDTVSVITQDTFDKPLQVVEDSQEQLEKINRLGRLFLTSNACVLVLTIIPVLVNLPSIYRDWYGMADIIRLIEPIVALPINLVIFLEILSIRKKNPLENLHLTILFGISLAIYQQGAGFHSAANMFKHPVETVQSSVSPTSDTYSLLQTVYSWIRNTWEHLISHYMYAAGGILTSWIFAFGFRDLVYHNGLQKKLDMSIWLFAIATYGLVIGAIAIEYPYGAAVALVLIIGYGYGVLGYYYFTRHKLFLFGYCIVLQYYLISYTIALIIIIIWVAKNGFAGRNLE